MSDEIANAGEYLFGVGIWDEGLGIALADFTYENLQEDEVAFVFNNDDPITTLIKDAYKDRFLEHGGKIILEEGYSFTNMDFRTIAIKLQNADADTVVVIGFDESGLLLKQAEELGLDITFLGWDQFNTQGFKRNAGDAAAGAYFTFWAPPDAQRYEVFRAKYEAKYDEELIAPTLAATGYDAMMVVAEALRISVREEVTLKDAMHMVENHEGVTGTLTMEDDGVVRAIREDIFRFDEHLEPVPAS